MKNIAILVLAAGKSSRMDGIKQLEKINNKTLLDITLEKLKSIFPDKIYCVLGANADKIKAEITSKDIQFIENPNYEKGLSSSIVSGIEYFNKEALNFDGIYILLADQPGIETAYLESLLLLFQEHKDSIIASNYGNKLGVPAIFPKRYFSELLLIKGDKGAKEFLNERKSEVISPELSTNFFDIDTKEDLELFKNS
jgi:molybdenum cofactor cytidylyltransferase